MGLSCESGLDTFKRTRGVTPLKRVLIVEDDVMIADLLEEIIASHGFEVCGIASTTSKALRLADKHRPELAIVDVFLADGGLGTDLAPILMSLYNTGILYATATMDAMQGAQGHAFLTKPFRILHVPLALGVVATMVETATIPPLPSQLTSSLTFLHGHHQLSS